MVGPEAFTEVKLPRARQADAGARPDPRDRRRVRASVRPRRPAGSCAATAARTRRRSSSRSGSVLGTIEDVVDELRDEGVQIGALGDQVLPALPARGGARGAAPRRSAWSCWRRRSPSASAASSRPNVRLALSGIAAARSTTVVAGLGGRADHQGVAAPRCSTTRSPTGSSRCTFLDLDRDVVERELARDGASAASGPHAENILRDIGIVAAAPALRRRTHGLPADQVLPGRHLRGRQPAARPRRSARCRRDMDRSNSLTSGHRACQGCGEALGARYALDAAMRATERPADRGQRDRLPRGVLDALPRVVVAAAVDPLAVRQRAGGRDRHRRGAEGQGPRATSA